MTRMSKFRGASALVGLTVASLVIASVPSVALSSAAWNDTEWASGIQGTGPGIGVLDCDPATNFSTRGEGTLLGGSVLATDLDTLVGLTDMLVTNNGTVSDPDPNPPLSTQGSSPDEYYSPLGVTALSAISVNVTPLSIPLGQPVGVLNQYAEAESNGQSAGAASGIVNNEGAIDVTQTPPGPGLPTFATFGLSSFLGNLGITGVSNLSDLSLELGVLGSSATLDACESMWDGDVYANLVRSYYIAGLEANIASPLVASLNTTATTAVTGVQTAVNGLAGNAGLIAALETAVLGQLDDLPIVGLLLDNPEATITATIDLTAVNSLITTPIEDAGGIVSIDLAAGTITVNIAELFDSVNGLNNQLPNTQILINDAVINALVAAVSTALTQWTANLQAQLNLALSLVAVDVAVDLDVVGLAEITVNAEASLAALLNGTADLTVDVNCFLVGTCGVVDALVDSVMNLGEDALSLLLYNTINPVLTTAVGTTVSSLATSLPLITAPLVTLLSQVLLPLFGQSSLLSLVVNAQNAPNPPGDPAHPEPTWGALPGPTASPWQSGRYDVAAMRIVILGAVGTGVALNIARSSVGSNGPN
ncbi:hypothetical protein BH10ACT7_BH10ACT7_20560 [soil metagenome]